MRGDYRPTSSAGPTSTRWPDLKLDMGTVSAAPSARIGAFQAAGPSTSTTASGALPPSPSLRTDLQTIYVPGNLRRRGAARAVAPVTADCRDVARQRGRAQHVCTSARGRSRCSDRGSTTPGVSSAATGITEAGVPLIRGCCFSAQAPHLRRHTVALITEQTAAVQPGFGDVRSRCSWANMRSGYQRGEQLPRGTSVRGLADHRAPPCPVRDPVL
jgi:hypothetical protein